jgi:hypothetical protein
MHLSPRDRARARNVACLTLALLLATFAVTNVLRTPGDANALPCQTCPPPPPPLPPPPRNLLDPPTVAPPPSAIHIHNLYMDSDWDGHNASTPRAALDDFTRRAIASGYFSRLRQYGVNSVDFTGSDQATAQCSVPNPGATFDMFFISGWVLCEKHALPAGPPGTVWMVYAPHSLGFNMVGYRSCVNYAGGSFTAFHYYTLPSVVPPDGSQVYGIAFAQCTPDLRGLTRAASHELVEAATDPVPPGGWVDRSVAGFLGIDVFRLLTEGEAADICDDRRAPYGQLANGAYLLDPYWSNTDGSCFGSNVSGAAGTSGPSR